MASPAVTLILLSHQENQPPSLAAGGRCAWPRGSGRTLWEEEAFATTLREPSTWAGPALVNSVGVPEPGILGARDSRQQPRCAVAVRVNTKDRPSVE